MSRTLRQSRRRAGRTPVLESLEGRRLPTVYVSTIGFAPAADKLVREDAGQVELAVVRIGDLSKPATVRVTTVEGTAVARGDFVPVDRTVEFAPGRSEATITIPIVADAAAAPARAFTVRLSDAQGAAALWGTTEATVAIADADFQDVAQTFLDYGEYGVWAYSSATGFRKINDVSPEAIIPAGTGAFFDYGPAGLWHWAQGKWEQINGADPDTVLASDGNAAIVSFGTFGLWSWRRDAGFVKINDLAPVAMTGGSFDAELDYGRHGVWHWNITTSWSRSDRPALKASATSLNGMGFTVYDYGAGGLWARDYGGAWSKINDASPESMKFVGETLYLDYGAGGFWRWSMQDSWSKVNDLDATSMVFAGTQEGDTLFVAFAGAGIWMRRPDGTMTRIGEATPEAMLATISDQGTLLLDFGAGGFWSRRLDGSYEKLNDANVESMSTFSIF